MCQEKKGGKSDEPLQLFLCADRHQFSPCRRHKCVISPWKLKTSKRGRKANKIHGASGEWELHCLSCLDCTWAPVVRNIHARWEFRKNVKHNWCEVVRDGDKKSFKAIIKLSSNSSEYKQLKAGTQKTSRPTKGDEVNIKAGCAHAGLPGKILLFDKHNAKPLKVKFENGKTFSYREDEVEHKREIQYRTKWKYHSVKKNEKVIFDFIPHETAEFPKRKVEGKVIMVNDSEISVQSEIRNLVNEHTGTPNITRTSYKLLARHYNCKLSVCQLARKGPKCGCKETDVIPPEIILMHKKLNQPLSPNLDGPARVLCTKAETNANNIFKLARELDKHIAAVPSESPILELWRKFRVELKLHENASGEYSGANRVNFSQQPMAISSTDLSPQPMSFSSTDLRTKKHRTAVNDPSSEFRSQDSKLELNKIFGDSNEWGLADTSDPSLDLMGGMTPDTQTTKDGDYSNASVGRVQKDKAERDSSLERFAKGLSDEFSSISSSLDNLSYANSNSKSVDSDAAVPLYET